MLGTLTTNLRVGLGAYDSHSQRLDGYLGLGIRHVDDLMVRDCGKHPASCSRRGTGCVPFFLCPRSLLIPLFKSNRNFGLQNSQGNIR